MSIDNTLKNQCGTFYVKSTNGEKTISGAYIMMQEGKKNYLRLQPASNIDAKKRYNAKSL